MTLSPLISPVELQWSKQRPRPGQWNTECAFFSQMFYFYLCERSCFTLNQIQAANWKESFVFSHVVLCHTIYCIFKSDGGSVCLPKELQVLVNRAQHHKVLYKPLCVTNTLICTAALTTVKATEGGLWNFNSLNALGAILGSRVSMRLLSLVLPFPISEWNVQGDRWEAGLPGPTQKTLSKSAQMHICL